MMMKVFTFINLLIYEACLYLFIMYPRITNIIMAIVSANYGMCKVISSIVLDSTFSRRFIWK